MLCTSPDQPRGATQTATSTFTSNCVCMIELQVFLQETEAQVSVEVDRYSLEFDACMN